MTNSLSHQSEVLQERLGLQIAARLSQGSDSLPSDILERLRHARTQAVAQRKVTQAHPAASPHRAGSSVVLGGPSEPSNAWQRVTMVLPILALLIGLAAIDHLMDVDAAQDIARLDAALLVDDLPPAAYADPGFRQFLRLQPAHSP